MESLVIIAGFVLLLIGFIGIFLPIFPSTLASYASLLLLHFSGIHSFHFLSLMVFALITLLSFVIDYILPIWGAKKYGGTKSGMIGAMIGGILSIFTLPFFGFFGIIILFIFTFIGAFLGEIIVQKNRQISYNAAYGAIIGLFLSSIGKFIIALIFTFIYIFSFL